MCVWRFRIGLQDELPRTAVLAASLEGCSARLLGRFPKISAAAEPTRRDTLVLRGFDVLPVTVA